MKQLAAGSLFLLIGWLAVAPQAQAQSLVIDLMPFVGYGGDVTNQVADRGSVSGGLEAHIGIRTMGNVSLLLDPAVSFYFIQADASGLELELNLLLAAGSTNKVISPWIGIGGKLARVSGDDLQALLVEGTDFGFNIIGGSAFGAGDIRPFFQLWYTIGDIGLYLEEDFGPAGASGFGGRGGIAFRIN